MSDNPWLFPLPAVVNPPTICLQVEIPNDQNHIAAFLGMLERLSIWFNWQRDIDHTGLAASNVWKPILNDVIKQLTAGGNCPPDFGFPGADDGSDFMIRQNPDNPCLLESSVNGTDWCVFADISKCMNFGTQPGTTTDQPKPGGGTQQTCKKLAANGALLLPTLVNTGDTVTLDSADGAGHDGSGVDGTGLWRLPNGDQYFGGLDVGFPKLVGTDPLPATNHMQLILASEDPVFYLPLAVGATVTIPSGVSNAQIWVQVNDSDVSDNQGDYDVCVTVTNNQSGAWSSTFDFTLNSYAGMFSIPAGQFVLGQGMVGTDFDAHNHSFVAMTSLATGVQVTTQTLFYSCGGQSGGEAILVFWNGSSYYGSPTVPIVGTNEVYSNGSAATLDTPGFQCGSGDDPGTCVVAKWVVTGVGPKPAGWP